MIWNGDDSNFVLDASHRASIGDGRSFLLICIGTIVRRIINGRHLDSRRFVGARAEGSLRRCGEQWAALRIGAAYICNAFKNFGVGSFRPSGLAQFTH